MNSYEYISIIAVFCYAFLILMFMASQKNRIIRAFIAVLFSMLFWTMGSVLMREQVAPSYILWYHVSIAGLLSIPYTFFAFIRAYTNSKSMVADKIYLIALVIIYVINVWSGLFIKYPEIVRTDRGQVFQYKFTFWVVVVFLVTAVILFHSLLLVMNYCRKNPGARKSIMPILQGATILVLGHMALSLPIFHAFPIDIICGIVNAFFMLKAVANKHLFELRLLGSKGVYYGIGIGISVMLFYQLFPYILDICSIFFAVGTTNFYLLYSAIFFGICFLVSQIGKIVLNNIFIKDEADYAEKIKLFSNEIANTLSLDKIMNYLTEMIMDINAEVDIYICLRGEKGYEACFSNQVLYDLSFVIKNDNPIVDILQEDSFVSLRDLQQNAGYRSIWESEKDQLRRLNITHFIALKNDNELSGIMMLSAGNKIHYNELIMISSVASMASIAIKNAQLYEQVYQEARTDELTGLLNRKHFEEVLRKIFETNKDDVIAFAILNLDDFKLYNNLYGTEEGDLALKRIAQIIKTSVSEQGVVARYSGKEFAVVLPKYDVFTARTLVETICEQIAELNEKGTQSFKLKTLTVSVGISSYPYGAVNLQELIRHADMAVYHVKRKGKNGIQIFDTVLKNQIHSQEARSSKDVYKDYESTIFALMAAIDAKDHYTFSHSHNVAYYATTLALLMGYDSDVVEMIRQSALLHDIGKISIPEAILNKTGKLTKEEFEIMKQHVEAAVEIIRHLPSLDYVVPAVIGHHERYDGYGYPRRICGENIPLFARMLCIADSFDAMTSKRCYKDKMSVEKSLSILEEEAGGQFDPNLVSVFVDGFHSGKIQLAENLTIKK